MDFFDKLFSQPIFIAIAVGLLALLLYYILKKLIKFILIVLIAIGVFLAYVHFKGGDVRQTINRGKEKASGLLDSLKN